MFRVLVVENDEDLNIKTCAYLRQNGFEAKECLDTESAYKMMNSCTYNLIISDIMLPDKKGFELIQRVREKNADIPIIFTSKTNDIATKRKSFNLGVDDFMAKPIEQEELILRINALLRRTKLADKKQLSIGNLLLDADERIATYKGKEISLTAREFNIIYKMLSCPRKTFSRAQLMDKFWGINTPSNSRTVDVYITKLRDKFSSCYEFEIVTVHGSGYKAVIR